MLQPAIGPNPALFAADGLLFIGAFLIGVFVTWRALGVLKWDRIVFDPIGTQTRVLRFLLSLFGGLIVGLTAFAYIIAAQLLRTLL